MDRLTEMQAFVQVVDQGGFSEAARKIGVSKSAISKHVSALEARLGVRLLNRTTRRVSTTDIGLAYYERANTVLLSAAEADEMVTAMQEAPRGTLRITVPVNFGETRLAAAVSGFLLQFPDVSIEMVLDDAYVDLVSEGFDLAVRIGQMGDSSLKARKLGTSRMDMVAAPGYLEARGRPESLAELAQHDLLQYSVGNTGSAWRVRLASGEEKVFRANGRVIANNGSALLSAAAAGLGICAVPCFIADPALHGGQIEKVLPDLPLEPLGIHAVFPTGRYMQPKLRAFIDYLAENFKNLDA